MWRDHWRGRVKPCHDQHVRGRGLMRHWLEGRKYIFSWVGQPRALREWSRAYPKLPTAFEGAIGLFIPWLTPDVTCLGGQIMPVINFCRRLFFFPKSNGILILALFALRFFYDRTIPRDKKRKYSTVSKNAAFPNTGQFHCLPDGSMPSLVFSPRAQAKHAGTGVSACGRFADDPVQAWDVGLCEGALKPAVCACWFQRPFIGTSGGCLWNLDQVANYLELMSGIDETTGAAVRPRVAILSW